METTSESKRARGIIENYLTKEPCSIEDRVVSYIDDTNRRLNADVAIHLDIIEKIMESLSPRLQEKFHTAAFCSDEEFFCQWGVTRYCFLKCYIPKLASLYDVWLREGMDAAIGKSKLMQLSEKNKISCSSFFL